MVSKEVLQEYKNAILTLNSDKVQELLNQGVRVNVKVSKSNPLDWLMTMEEEDMQDFLKYGLGRTDLAEALPAGIDYKVGVRKTVDVLLENDIRLFEKLDDGVTYDQALAYKVDDFLLSENKEALADMVLYTIKQSVDSGEEVYKFFNAGMYANMVREYIDRPQVDFSELLTKKIEAMRELHDAIAMRLADPKTELEKQLSGEYAQDITFWTDTLSEYHLEDVIDNINYLGERYIEHFGEQTALVKVDPKQYKIGVDISIQKMKRDGEIFILPEETPQEVLNDLDQLVGLEKEKKDFLKWAIEITKSDPDDPEEVVGYSSAYLGNPGTAKTSLTRLKVRFLHSLGLVGDSYAEGTAKDLIGGYVGQTRIKTQEFLTKADTVFIDEAYGLYAEGAKYNYGAQAVDVLVDYIENNRSNPVFFAGYPDSMQKLFTMNEGLISRVRDVSNVEDYSIEVLGEIFDRGLKARGYKGIEIKARQKLFEDLEFHKGKVDPKFFGNAREVRLILDDINGVVKERCYKIDNELEKGSSLAAVFTKISNRKALKKRDIIITEADIEALNIREKHKTVNANKNTRPIGFRAINDDGKKADVAAQFKRKSEACMSSDSNIVEFKSSSSSSQLGKEHAPYRGTTIGFTAQ